MTALVMDDSGDGVSLQLKCSTSESPGPNAKRRTNGRGAPRPKPSSCRSRGGGRIVGGTLNSTSGTNTERHDIISRAVGLDLAFRNSAMG